MPHCDLQMVGKYAFVLKSVSLNQPVLSFEGKVSCSWKHWEPLMGSEITPDPLPLIALYYQLSIDYHHNPTIY